MNLPLSSLQDTLALSDNAFREKFGADKPPKHQVPPALGERQLMAGSHILL